MIYAEEVVKKIWQSSTFRFGEKEDLQQQRTEIFVMCDEYFSQFKPECLEEED